jgi:hypothetical protein
MKPYPPSLCPLSRRGEGARSACTKLRGINRFELRDLRRNSVMIFNILQKLLEFVMILIFFVEDLKTLKREEFIYLIDRFRPFVYKIRESRL